jgi:hypothetical protein
MIVECPCISISFLTTDVNSMSFPNNSKLMLLHRIMYFPKQQHIYVVIEINNASEIQFYGEKILQEAGLAEVVFSWRFVQWGVFYVKENRNIFKEATSKRNIFYCKRFKLLVTS